MWYPEESVSYCRKCDLEIPADCYWRGRGFIINGNGRQQRTPILYSVCPECSRRQSVGLDGPWPYRVFYTWMWKLRYPQKKAPEMEATEVRPSAVEVPRRRASGE
jgi:hypothetical protein